MGKHYILILSVLFLHFGANCQTLSGTPTFLKEYHNFKSDTSIIVAIPLNDNFYCLKSNSEVVVINGKSNLIDATYSDNSKSLDLTNLFLTTDTIIGTSKAQDYYLSGNKWLPLGRRFKLPPVFEDDKFVVTSTCSGEWGGSIYFRDKRTGKLYECQSTCTVNVLKKDNRYFITSMLAHMSGFTNIFEIDDPTKLKLYNFDSIQKKANADKNRGKIRIYPVGYNESKSQRGTIQLVDSIGVLAITSFMYDSKIFYLIIKDAKTDITTIKNNKLVTLDTLFDKNLWIDASINRVYPDRVVCSFNGDNASGFVDIQNNRLVFYSFNWRHI